jgi:hypothetical protein
MAAYRLSVCLLVVQTKEMRRNFVEENLSIFCATKISSYYHLELGQRLSTTCTFATFSRSRCYSPPGIRPHAICSATEAAISTISHSEDIVGFLILYSIICYVQIYFFYNCTCCSVWVWNLVCIIKREALAQTLQGRCVEDILG